MGKPPEAEGFLVPVFLILYVAASWGQVGPEYGCPAQEKISPCRCSTRDMEFQIWCSHSELPRVLEGLKTVSRIVEHPIDELILENNNLPSLPGKVFASLRVLRLMLRNNRLERISSSWLEGLNDSLLELFIVEPELRSLPEDSLETLQGLEAITLQSKSMKRLPKFSGLSKLRYLQINSLSLAELTPRHFRELPTLEQIHVFGSQNLVRLEAGLFRDLPRLTLINISDCGVHWVHPRALIGLPELKEISLVGNAIVDAGMIGHAVVDLPSLSVLNLNRNLVSKIGESSFVDLPMLARLSLADNLITEIFSGAFQRVPVMRVLDLNHNAVHRIHPEFFYPQRSGGSLEEMWLIDNDLDHVSELRSILEALPKLKFLDLSYNFLEKIPFGALRGHPTIERLHLDHNRLNFLQGESFSGMPALRELRLRNNSLSNLLEMPFWNLPALKGLDLSSNYFRHVDASLLGNLPSLRRLDLSGNSIALIEPDSFLRTPSLEQINISGNALSVLHPLTFRHLSNLYELDLGWNRLLEIIPGLPRNIEHLHLPMNRIVALPPLGTHILSLPVLKSFDMSANGIERILPGALSKLPSLRKLELGYNALKLLDDGTFEGLMNLERLDLGYNRLVALHGRSLRPLRRLVDLNLRENRLEVVRPDVFQENVKLQRLDLSRNNLAQIPHATFASTRDLRELQASHNSLIELPRSLHGLETLEVLDLSFNKLNVLSPETLSSLTSLLELKLVKNRIKELREGAFTRLPRLSLIDLENNDLRVVERGAIKSLPELQVIRLGKNRIQMIPSGAFSELPVLQIAELQENRIRDISNNAFINVPHLLYLNLSHNLLPSLDYTGLESLRSLEVLDLSSNHISRVSGDHLSAMEWLVELKMDNNRVCEIVGTPFDDMPRLRVLSLRHNKMASVSENAFKRLRSNIAVLDIDGNPLSCSCGMIWLQGWLQQATSAEGPRCADGSLFKEVQLSRQDCQREKQIEPAHLECEAETIDKVLPTMPTVLGHESNVPWMNLKKHQIRPSLDADYFYEDYADFANSTDQTKSENMDSPGPTLAAVNAPNRVQLPIKDFGKNVTSMGKKRPWSSPSPSSSGFTFFGVPLPSLNFNLWGNSGKKSHRKDDFTSRPGRSRNRFQFPEIHRGGFTPLPIPQGGFVPMTNFGDQAEDNSSLVKVYEELKRHNSNYTIAKIERTNASKIKTPAVPNEGEELSTVGTVQDSVSLPSAVDAKKVISLEPNKITQTSPQTYVEPLLPTEIGPKMSMETAGTTSKPTRGAVVKETVTASVEVFVSKKKHESSDKFSQIESKQTNSSLNPTSTETSTPENTGLEASALSAFLVPGGQVPTSRASGRSTITKVSSPNFGSIAEQNSQNGKITTITNSSNVRAESQSSAVDEANPHPFDWYFRNYNYTTEEPYEAVVYNRARKTMFIKNWRRFIIFCAVFGMLIFY